MKAQRRTLRIAGFSLVGLVALTVALFVWMLYAGTGSWTTRVTEAIAESRARDPRRPVMRGEAISGSAWTDYEQALDAVASVAIDDVRRWLDGAASDRANAVAILSANESALDFLRAGARKAEGAYPVQWEKGGHVFPLVRVRNLTTLAVGRARLVMVEGKPQEAADLLLDAAQLAADLGRNATVPSELVALASLGQVFDGLKRLPPDPEVGKALAVLDSTFPSHAEAMLNDLALIGVQAIYVEPDLVTPTWRFGFSRRLMMADAWPTLEDMIRRLAAATAAPWGEAQRVAAEIEAQARGRSSNPVVQTAVPPLFQTHRESRALRAQLRLLRALHGGATGLDDPFGDKLLFDGGKVWSVGADGIDGGGAGAWTPAPTGDIVLEVPAR
jgi:hypothetical protein